MLIGIHVSVNMNQSTGNEDFIFIFYNLVLYVIEQQYEYLIKDRKRKREIFPCWQFRNRFSQS